MTSGAAGGRTLCNLPYMADTSTQSIVIAAPPDRVAAVICDFARYPEWVSATKEVEVLEEYEDGYASQVRFVLDAGVVTAEYTLEYEYAEDISRIEWHLVEPSKSERPSAARTTWSTRTAPPR
jgi:ribosome-associated toxin RatA of RatAB toxin-antitoxin module